MNMYAQPNVQFQIQQQPPPPVLSSSGLVVPSSLQQQQNLLESIPITTQPSQILVYLSLFISLLIIMFLILMAWSLYSNYMFIGYRKLLFKRANNDNSPLNLWESMDLLYKLRLSTLGGMSTEAKVKK